MQSSCLPEKHFEFNRHRQVDSKRREKDTPSHGSSKHRRAGVAVVTADTQNAPEARRAFITIQGQRCGMTDYKCTR